MSIIMSGTGWPGVYKSHIIVRSQSMLKKHILPRFRKNSILILSPYALTVSWKKTPKKNFLTTDPPLPPSLWLTVKNLGFVKISYTYQYKYMLKMHFSASSQ